MRPRVIRAHGLRLTVRQWAERHGRSVQYIYRRLELAKPGPALADGLPRLPKGSWIKPAARTLEARRAETDEKVLAAVQSLAAAGRPTFRGVVRQTGLARATAALYLRRLVKAGRLRIRKLGPTRLAIEMIDESAGAKK